MARPFINAGLSITRKPGVQSSASDEDISRFSNDVTWDAMRTNEAVLLSAQRVCRVRSLCERRERESGVRVCLLSLVRAPGWLHHI